MPFLKIEMPVQKITIEEFLKLAKQYPVLDVRSPGEYKHAHIPDSTSACHYLPMKKESRWVQPTNNKAVKQP